ncbi:Heavy metal-associated isoprenylated plant protein [Vigna angularis]|uniref:Heavy metal-associated isoprenylated plant protein n=1 Tax=Phaseolus angularis TaxID=3914 RepID=A0A8T0JVY9_PHAAN|nr:heavy metal-associated isoprenylated plant protein 39 isoform X1 [Vigna angularis]XP_052722713.1 heavy metal-associated isoprenylated plant protein 39 isoform X1 [Vigna angularis]KAG2384724.1 Heavy metal-associated isoprenylated plant protein [Vigna angularis]
MMKVVLKVDVQDEKIRKKAMQRVCGISGVESVSVDMKDNKITVIGDVDSVKVAIKLKKLGPADILSVGPAKEPKKEEKPPEPKKDPKEEYAQLLKIYEAYFNQIRHQPYPYYYNRTVEDNPCACVIC